MAKFDLKAAMAAAKEAAKNPEKFEPQGGKKYEVDKRKIIFKGDQNNDNKINVRLRFLPSIYNDEKIEFFTQFKIHNQNDHPRSKRFINELCPQTVGRECPICQEGWDVWNATKEEALRNGLDEKKAKEAANAARRPYQESTKFITNIMVIDDPQNPENNGKIFLWEYGKTISDIIRRNMNPEQDEIQLKGIEPFDPWDLKEGRDFMLKRVGKKLGDITYEQSFFLPVDKSTNFPEEEHEAIFDKTYDLYEFNDPKNFKDDEYLLEKIHYMINGADSKKQNTKSNTVNESEKKASLSNTETSVEDEMPEWAKSKDTEPAKATDDFINDLDVKMEEPKNEDISKSTSTDDFDFDFDKF